jgi:hypothetical protein
MRVAAFFVALFAIVIGVAGIVSPDSLTAARRHILDMPVVVLSVAGFIRIAMGLVLIVFAPASRTPKILRLMGVVMALQGIAPLFIGIDRERTILEREVILGHAVLRAGAVVALASGCFIAFVARRKPSRPPSFTNKRNIFSAPSIATPAALRRDSPAITPPPQQPDFPPPRANA